MGNLHLVTGYAGEAHITADDQGSLNAAVFGEGQFVLNRGNKLSASIVTNNQIKVLDGDILMQGRHIRLNNGTYVELAIENGAQGYNRNDLIVARYTKSSSTGVEDCNLIVIKGTATTGAASDPEYTSGDIISGNALQNDMPLYRVPINGLNVQDLVPLFTVIDNRLSDIMTLLAALNERVPNSRKVAGLALSSDITAAQLLAKLAHTHGISDITDLSSNLNAKVPTSRTVAGLALSSNISVSQLLTALAHKHAASDITSGTLPIARGGTGITSNPSMLVNLGSTTADTVLEASPRPGVTGTLPIANGGTGATNGATGLKNLFAAGNTVLSSYQYGTSLPTAGTKGRIFFKKV